MIKQEKRTLIDKLKNQGVLTLGEIKKLGVSQATVSTMSKANKLIKLSHGFYIHPSCNVHPEDLDFIIACKKFGKSSVIAGISALFHYKLIEQVPSQIWILVDYKKQTSNKFYRLLRVRKISSFGIIKKKNYKIVSLERALIEGLKYSNKIGLRIVIHAIKSAILDKKTTTTKLLESSKKLACKKILEKYWEVISEAINT